MKNNKILNLPKAALIQLLLFTIFFFVNMYSFFSEDGVDAIINIIRAIMVASLSVGIAAFILNRKQIFIDKKMSTLEILSLVSLSLLTGISFLATLSGIIVSLIV